MMPGVSRKRGGTSVRCFSLWLGSIFPIFKLSFVMFFILLRVQTERVLKLHLKALLFKLRERLGETFSTREGNVSKSYSPVSSMTASIACELVFGRHRDDERRNLIKHSFELRVLCALVLKALLQSEDSKANTWNVMSRPWGLSTKKRIEMLLGNPVLDSITLAITFRRNLRKLRANEISDSGITKHNMNVLPEAETQSYVSRYIKYSFKYSVLKLKFVTEQEKQLRREIIKIWIIH